MELYELFSEMIDYPNPNLSMRLNECISLLSSLNEEGAGLLKKFKGFLEKTPLGQMEEIYTWTFDLQAICYPYVGYYLFGEDHWRSLFMAGLKERYNFFDFSAGQELPDRLSVMLRFLSQQNNREREELISECILPVLKKMVAGFEGKENPYTPVLQALLLILGES